MRIVVCGKHREDVVKKIESEYGVDSINLSYPGMDDNNYSLFEYAAETFKHFNKNNVIFDGGVFDSFKFYSDEGWRDLQEQVILSSICNVDRIIIVKDEMNEKEIEFCDFFVNLYPEKIIYKM